MKNSIKFVRFWHAHVHNTVRKNYSYRVISFLGSLEDLTRNLYGADGPGFPNSYWLFEQRLCKSFW